MKGVKMIGQQERIDELKMEFQDTKPKDERNDILNQKGRKPHVRTKNIGREN